jgi:hypothetical protein
VQNLSKQLEQRIKELEKEAAERKLIEEELRESNRRLQVAYDQSIVYAQHLNEEISERKRVEGERERLVRDLQEALAEVKTLSGLLPICASCKKIRDDKGYWRQIEIYIRDHSEAEFSHSICPECVKKMYPNLQD